MNSFRVVDSRYFIVAGVSHKKTHINDREKFALSRDAIENIVKDYQSKGGESIFILSTCNRTEIYALTNDCDEILKLFFDYTSAEKPIFEKHVYLHKNEIAIQHLFNVGVGKESQIPGDFQIIGQLKEAFKIAKSLNSTNAFTERLINTVSQCSKAVKNKTDFSSGATSTSYAAVEHIKSRFEDFSKKNYLLFGSGKIGSHVCDNLVKQVGKEQITILNRTEEHAAALSMKHGIQLGKYANLQSHLKKADIVLVSTASADFTITRSHVEAGRKLFVDLSMPRNVEPSISEIEGCEIVSLDQLSEITLNNLKGREQQLTAVNTIVSKYFNEFMEWLEQRRLVPTIAAIRDRLDKIKEAEINRFKKENEGYNEQQLELLSSEIIQKFTNQLSGQLKSLPQENLELVHHLFNLDSAKV